jgi:hypothetical protein
MVALSNRVAVVGGLERLCMPLCELLGTLGVLGYLKGS